MLMRFVALGGVSYLSTAIDGTLPCWSVSPPVTVRSEQSASTYERDSECDHRELSITQFVLFGGKGLFLLVSTYNIHL